VGLAAFDDVEWAETNVDVIAMFANKIKGQQFLDEFRGENGGFGNKSRWALGVVL
jgi:hypothetical protein